MPSKPRGIPIADELHRAVKSWADNAGESLQDAYAEALQEWLEKRAGKTHPGSTPANKAEREMVETLWDMMRRDPKRSIFEARIGLESLEVWRKNRMR